MSSSSSSSSTEQYGENIVFNGSFTGSANGWILVGGFSYEDNHVRVDSSGPYVKKLVQTVSIKTNHQYLVSYELVVASGAVTTSVSLGGDSYGHGSSTGLLSTVLVPSNSDPLTISLSFYQDGVAYIDNVSVYEIIEQSTSSLSTSSSSTCSESTSSTYRLSSSSSVSTSSSSTLHFETSTSSSSSTIRQSTSTSSIRSSLSSSSSFSTLSSTLALLTSSRSISSSTSSSVSSSSLHSSSSSCGWLIYSSSSFSSSSSLSSISSESSSSSTLILSTSSSKSSQSSFSSLSSYYHAYHDLRFDVEVREDRHIWSMIRYKDRIYAGSGPDGVIFSSINGVSWDQFQRVDNAHVRTLYVWQDVLFIGTEPGGVIYIYNFATTRFYPWLITNDMAVTAFAELDSKLYAGTSPNGFVYSNDGVAWKEVFKLSGYGITEMVSTDNKMYIFVLGQEMPFIYDGEELSVLTLDRKEVEADYTVPLSGVIDENIFQVSESSSSQTTEDLFPQPGQNLNTIASLMKTKKEVFSLGNNYFIDRTKILSASNLIEKGILQQTDHFTVQPPVPDYLLSCAQSYAGDIYFGGRNLYKYNGKILKVLAQGEGELIEALTVLDIDTVIYSIGSNLYLTMP